MRTRHSNCRPTLGPLGPSPTKTPPAQSKHLHAPCTREVWVAARLACALRARPFHGLSRPGTAAAAAAAAVRPARHRACGAWVAPRVATVCGSRPGRLLPSAPAAAVTSLPARQHVLYMCRGCTYAQGDAAARGTARHALMRACDAQASPGTGESGAVGVVIISVEARPASQPG